MGWAKDGSGLKVKRVGGITVAPWRTRSGRVWLTGKCKRHVRRMKGSAHSANADMFKRLLTERRRASLV